MTPSIQSTAPPPKGGAPRPRRGYIIPAVLVITLVATTIAATMLSRMEGSIQAVAEVVRRRQAFYAADGVGRIVIAEVSRYLMENRDPSAAELADPANIPPPSIPGFALDAFQLNPAGGTWDGPIASGPFKGMYAQQTPVDLHVETRHLASGVKGEVDLRVNLAHVSLFQFFVFADDYIEIYPGANMTINPGRIHANGDLCMGSDASLKVGNATSASRLLAGGHDCRRTAGHGFHIWDGGAFVKMTSASDHGCTSCAGSGLDWADYAIQTWGGAAQDKAHAVDTLRLPTDGASSTQAGWDAAGVEQLNGASLRLLVDPPLPADPQAILDQKLAWQADLRIIDGVWYLNDGSWPGTPIWSDHPGTYVTANAEGIEGLTPRAVGQGDLAVAGLWLTPPHRYSYYEYNALAGDLYDDDRGVISYGSLIRRSASEWKPGYWATGTGGNTYTDAHGFTRPYFCAWCNGSTCGDSAALRDAAVPFCQYRDPLGAYHDLKGAQYLQATRGGFTDHRVRMDDPGQAGILPINFDVAAFIAALHDTGTGELGSHFLSRPFNGIVYITSTWPGSMGGFPDGHPAPWPPQGAAADESQARSRVTGPPLPVQQALPYNLCSDTLGFAPAVAPVPMSGPALDLLDPTSFNPHFAVPACSDLVTARPNAVRIINAQDIGSAALPEGLSIVTNLPMYVLGDVNTGSDTSAGDATPWSPFMLGADAVSLLSSAWRDDSSPFGDTHSLSARPAGATTYQFAYLGGIVQTTDGSHYSGGIENYPRFLENWSGITARIRGSLVVGFASVYQSAPWPGTGNVYNAPGRDWGFDQHLHLLVNQPPGAPLMSVHSISRLHRR